MTFLSKGTLTLCLLAAFAAIGTVSALDLEITTEEEAVQPFDLWDSGSATLLVSYADDAGHESVVNLTNEMKKQGKKIKEKNVKLAKQQKVKGAKAAKNEDDDEEDAGAGKRAKAGKRDRNRRLRFLQEDDTIATGFSIIEIESDDLEAEVSALGSLEGVTAVEEDGIMHIESIEYQQKLRGGGGLADHIREIQDAIRATAGEFPDDEVEFSPNLEGEEEADAFHGRRLAQETPYGITMVNASYVNSKPPVMQDPIKICVVDTGYDLGHPDLPNGEEHNVTGWHKVNADGSTPFNKWDIDGHGHGTHCAGTIGAIGTNDFGVTSVNPDPSKFQFIIGKGLSDSGSGSNANVMEAVQECVNAGAKVVSMSLGGTGSSSITEAFYKDQYDQGVLIIAAAGNSGADSWGYPAGYPPVMSVGSVMESGSLSYFSTRNTQVEITGPGHSVKSTHKNNGYTTMSGTSMACPHVAGVAALLWTHFPACTNNQIRNAMIRSAYEPPTTDAKNTPGWDKYYGWGTVNAGSAYDLLSKGCEVAGGVTDPPGDGELSDLAKGGKDQLDLGCTLDEHCDQSNPCLGTLQCIAGTCEQIAGSAPVCDDGKKCTIDTCDPSKPYNVLTDLCVFTPKACENGNMCDGIKDCDEETGSCYEKEPPVDCDDSNACTTDTCNPSTGICSNTALSCNDNNACTLNDTCDPLTGCIFEEPQQNCCGNAECEAGETESSCPVDCGDSLTTSFDTSIANRVELGPMFDIQTKSKNVTIAGFELNCYVPDGIESKVFVYSLPGGKYYDNGSWYKKYLWDLVHESSISCNGFGTPTPVTLAESVTVPKESKHSFFILIYTDSAATGYWFYKSMYPPSGKTARYSPLDEDSYLQIQTGSGSYCISGFCSIVSPRRPAITINYAVINDSPTTSPTISIMPSTPVPTYTPTTRPTPLPTTLAPTPVPTATPTPEPTSAPTDMPSFAPSESLAPTPFEPVKVTVSSPEANSATSVYSFYFDVTGGTVDSVITNIKLTTWHSMQEIKVFAKRGTGKESEQIPCDWQLVAETGNEITGYWKELYPTWTNGFQPVELFAGETISLYVMSNGRLLTKYVASSSLKYTPHFATPSSSPLPGINVSYAAYGQRALFKSYPSYYSSREFMGALDLETVAPGSTMSPTSAPTVKFSTNQIESADAGTENTYLGIQFDVQATSAVILKKFDLHVAAGTHFVEVWYRHGSHKGSSSGCAHHNNWCNKWMKAVGGTIVSSGQDTLTSTPEVSILMSAGDTFGLAVVFPHSGLVASTGADDATDGVLTIKSSGSLINDYYGNEVNTIHDLESTSINFKGKIEYDIANSFCATISAQNGVLSDVDDIEPDVTEDNITEPSGPVGDGAGGPMDGNEPMDGMGDGFDSLS
mmetsp:Transcript_5909/g.8582  ORF Transcript_5909/g.8582 Transcript_5909/m.8582 type:complete len:1387 (+) Transcript_5909:150-4310(+)|eukprot:CAMPEP_0201687986 /NCGR_PEP_ID=MMETSP0578-20130828/1787_1 /ASSEMBLY_ACC=CAM_ASM_000663 /TAXON_ID=267565 /ORGANISM="Skeletonema grethea, Strain CCMP 1804" /LENGTH=1386 /DNA_ID=CAMNT_0048172175 /DNA_START=76 /DNA_END=4236 /DNA_ORIENTATION=+